MICLLEPMDSFMIDMVFSGFSWERGSRLPLPV